MLGSDARLLQQQETGFGEEEVLVPPRLLQRAQGQKRTALVEIRVCFPYLNHVRQLSAGLLSSFLMFPPGASALNRGLKPTAANPVGAGIRQYLPLQSPRIGSLCRCSLAQREVQPLSPSF